MKSDKQYFAEVQANIIKQVGKMKPEDRFARWEINLGGYDYSMYVMENGAVGYIIPRCYDFLSGIGDVVKGVYGTAPDFINNLVSNNNLIDCHLCDVKPYKDISVAEFSADGHTDTMIVDYKFFKEFNKHNEFSYKFSQNGKNIALYIYRSGFLVALVMALREVDSK